jgi:transcriptional regulator with XRE-family HTH domain
VSSSPSPVVANWELVLRLRARREELGLGIKDLADPLGFTRNYWSAIENERKPIPTTTLIAVFDVLGLNGQERRELLKLHQNAQSNGWWHQYPALLDNDVERLLGLEHGAREQRSYEPILIPGLLQTADYTRAIMHSGIIVRPVEVEQRVALRLRRQKRLEGDNPLKLQALICEATLRQQIGGMTTLKGQLDHLLTVIDEHPDNIDVRVIPFTADACTLFSGGSLCLLSFHSPRLPPWAVWTETVSEYGFISDTGQVHNITTAFDQAVRRSLSRRETVKLIQKHRRELR